ncbi:hypothetical protein D9756_008019 [Leucocoprinus leucothites]|uniref:Uncharacterized protein n=1 Tax=Leucocoprinus leucothites TaxID=201217 RepID=A0A8H5FYC3_9AGAR|nr:hypothetical protein D9756_008019 [Leucoagaricus leucothites]
MATLHSLGIDRDLWVHFASELESRPGYSRLESPWREYTAVELSKWVLSRIRVDELWQSSMTPQPRIRSLGSEFELKITQKKLLPGGRWLLGVHPFEAQMYSVDLESPDPSPQLFINVECAEIEPRFLWKYWVDKSQPRLTLRVAFFQLPHADWSQTQIPIDIFDVELEGHGADAKLRSRLISTFRHSITGRHMVCCLDGEYYVEVRRDIVSTLTVVKYCDGGQPINPDLIIPRTIVIGPPRFSSVHILWGTHIVILTRDRIHVYSMDQFSSGSPPTNLDDTPPVHSIVTWTALGAGLRMLPNPLSKAPSIHHDNSSEPLILDDAARFTFASGDYIWGIHIPRDLKITPQLLKVTNLPVSSYSRFGMGHRHSIFVNLDSIVAIRHEKWNDPGAGSCAEIEIESLLSDDWVSVGRDSIGYCEELGRIVLIASRKPFREPIPSNLVTELLVIDLV